MPQILRTYSEDELIQIITDCLREWATEECDNNDNMDLSFECRFDENRNNLIDAIEDIK